MVAFVFTTREELERHEPKSYDEVVNNKQSQNWIATMNNELSFLYKNGSWVLADNPKGKKLVTCKWLFKLKEGIPGVEHAIFKARLVGRSFTQCEGIDYN